MYDMVADDDSGKVDGQSLHARWWLKSASLYVQTPLYFGQKKMWAEDDWDAAYFFCFLRLSFAALCLSASSLGLALLPDQHQMSGSEASSCHD